MNYSKFVLSNWKRKEHFEILKSYGQCTFSQTVQLDITNVIAYTKSQGFKFYPVMIHLISRIVNRFPEFKMAIKDDDLIIWDVVDPSYTIFHSESETFSSLWSNYHPNLEYFLSSYRDDNETYGENLSYFPKGFIENVFYVSANPWVSFTSFDFNLANIDNVFAPMFTIGKYHSKDGRTYVPLAVQVHHAVCDGFHVGRLINELQEACDQLGR